MSKIGKLPIEIKEGTNVTLDRRNVTVSGVKGELSYVLPRGIKADLTEGVLTLTQERENDRKLRALYGLSRALLANMVTGVEKGFEKKLELVGVGFRAQMQGEDLVLSLGFAHPVRFAARQGLKMEVKDNVITVSGIDKMLVGEQAANIRAVKKPEPYKGKGIKYIDEVVRRKAGKAAKAVGGAK